MRLGQMFASVLALAASGLAVWVQPDERPALSWQEAGLLKQASVVAELKLTQAQMLALRNFWAAQNQAIAPPRGEDGRRTVDFTRPQTNEEAIKVLEKREADRQLQIDALLSAAQAKRLRQISVQLHRPQSFPEPEVTAALKLTAAQQKTVTDGMAKVQASMPPADPRKQAAWAKEIHALRRSVNENVMRQLTMEQRESWSKLVGKSFTGKIGN